MEINELASLGYAIATLLFALLAISMSTFWRERPKAGFVGLACGATAIWAALQAVGALGYLNDPFILLVIEWVRDLAWLTALASILRDLSQSHKLEEIGLRYGSIFFVATVLIVAYYWATTRETISMVATVGGGIALSALIVILAEQVYRNAPFDARSSLKYLCLGVGGIYIYDFVIFGLTVVNDEMNINQWAARGFVTALFALPLGTAAKRSIRLSLDAYIPRQIIFYSFGAIAAGTFIVCIMLGDYYVRIYGGEWGDAIRVVLFMAAVMALAVALISASIRARVRVFLTKSFFQYKYDYRKEWLRFIDTLSGSEHDNVVSSAVRSVAQIVNSPGGAVWVLDEQRRKYQPIGAWGMALPVMAAVHRDSRLVRFLKRQKWVIDLVEVSEDPARYEGLELEDWMAESDEWWLIVPLLLGQRLLGFMMLQRPKVAPELNFEDHDLLRTVGRHAATHIEQAESDRRLAEASQFGAYNRLTAFLMHDLNNLIAQQSLVVKNAEKYRHNPEFVDDAIGTIANSVDRMRRLMEQLSNSSSKSTKRVTDLGDVLKRAAARVRPRLPKPELTIDGNDLQVEADPERLVAITEHLIRNAQDASDESGEIGIDVSANGQVATVQIRDTGCGMTPEFIRERLFQPFDSTKGSQSMGIGAYQAREYVTELGGQLEVESTPGKGTIFSVHLPLARPTEDGKPARNLT
jgi:putative PEP-CTERM system histidine kinase